MQCTLYIDVDIVKNGRTVAYKYVIYSPNRKDARPYEFFHDHPRRSGYTNRCLIVPLNRGEPKGNVDSKLLRGSWPLLVNCIAMSLIKGIVIKERGHATPWQNSVTKNPINMVI